MKRLKRLLAVLTALSLVITGTVPAFAEGVTAAEPVFAESINETEIEAAAAGNEASAPSSIPTASKN